MSRFSAKRDVYAFLFLLGASATLCVLFGTAADSNTARTSRSLGQALGTIETRGTSTTFLLGIFSMLSEEEAHKRQIIRETYLSLKNEQQFCSLRDFMKRSVQDRSTCKVPYIFVVGANEEGPAEHVDNSLPLTIDPLTVDDPEEDVIYLNIRENMQDGKSPTWLKYAAGIAAYYDIDYVAKADSDTLFYPKRLFEMIDRDLPPAPHNRRIYGGKTEIHPQIERGSVYMAGQFYFVSSDLAHYVSNTLSTAQRKALNRHPPTEDVDIGSYVFSHSRPIRLVTLSHHRVWVHMKDNEGFRNHYDRIKVKRQVKIKRDDAFHFYEMCRAWERRGDIFTAQDVGTVWEPPQ